MVDLNIGIPELIWFALAFFNVGYNSMRTTPHLIGAIIGVIGMSLLLYWGGFFS